MSYKLSLKTYKSTIRRIKIGEVVIGGENALSFMQKEMNDKSSPVFALEVLMNTPKNYSNVLKEAWGNLVDDMYQWAMEAQKTPADMIALRFNVDEERDIELEIKKACELFEKIQTELKKPLIVLGSFKKNIDTVLLPKLAEIAKQSCIFGPVEDESYKEVIPSLIKNNHYVIARTPIDINLAKELNILISELGMDADRIIIDPNLGALGYGLDYGYSIIERIKLAGLDGDKMLNMPILGFIGEESYKSKETKSVDFDENWGDLTTRALAWESMTAASIMAAGANLLLLWHPEVLKTVKSFVVRK